MGEILVNVDFAVKSVFQGPVLPSINMPFKNLHLHLSSLISLGIAAFTVFDRSATPALGQENQTPQNQSQVANPAPDAIAIPAASAVPAQAETSPAPLLPEPETVNLDLPRLVMKNGSYFLVLRPDGMMGRSNTPYGLFKDDTRFLSGYELLINEIPPNLVASDTKEGYYGKFAYLTKTEKGEAILQVVRELVLQDGLAEHVVITNQAPQAVSFKLTLNFAFDYKDMFEVRGQKRKARGISKVEVINGQKVSSLYTGLDTVQRTTILETVNIPGASATENNIKADIVLNPGEKLIFEVAVDTEKPVVSADGKAALEDKNGQAITTRYQRMKDLADKTYKDWTGAVKTIKYNGKVKPEDMQTVYKQAVRDLFLLKQTTDGQAALAAGLPWYAVPFGRDQVVTGIQVLSVAPALSKDIILFLANHQGKESNKYTEEVPGKIMHELRSGEMAKMKEIPFTPYYGTIDATPLWLVLLDRYVEETGDKELVAKLWPNIEAALGYLKSATPDDFLYYGGAQGEALSNQAWKDSGDSISHKDGSLAKAPIAVCEVQGYLYEAWQAGARMAKNQGKGDMESDLKTRAAKLKTHFSKSFWLPEEKFFALAIDSTAEPCSVISSNPGHLLDTGIINDDQAKAVVARLMEPDMFSGWGIRTLSSKEKRYDPKSYHNGSIWPHDNAIIVRGMLKRGYLDEGKRVINSLFEVALASPDKRLPELFCGYTRANEPTPTPYAVSCVPQAWCVGSVFEMMDALNDSKAKIKLR